MMQHISPDLMRAYAEFTPDGRPMDRNREKLRGFRQSLNERMRTPQGAIGAKPVSVLLASAITRLWLKPAKV